MEVPIPNVSHYRRNQTYVRDIPFGIVEQFRESIITTKRQKYKYEHEMCNAPNVRRPYLTILYQHQHNAHSSDPPTIWRLPRHST